MAIFVSNPTSAAPPPLIADGQDPTAVESLEGFTEELAAAMLPAGDAANVPAKPAVGTTEDPDKKASDLQILPAEVLMNAVGDANFALAAQANSAAAANASQKSEPQLDDPTSLDANANLQAAELAAANLAAQMSAASVTPVTQVAPVTLVPTVQASDAVQGLQVEQSLSSAGLSLPQTSVLNTPVQAANSAELNAAQNAKQAKALEAVAGQSNETPLVLNAPPEEVQAFEVSPANLSNASRSKTANLANSFQTSSSPDEKPASATPMAPVNAPFTAPLTATLTATLASSANAPASSAVNGTVNALVATTMSASESSSLPTQVAVNTAPVAQQPDALSVAQTTQTQSVSANAATSANSQANVSNAKANQTALEETAFQFDAKLSKPEEVSSKGLTASFTSSAASAASTSSALSDASDPSVLSSATPSASTSSHSRLNAATESDMASGVNANAALPAETSPASTQSLEDLSSSFVSSLVGGPQRPVNTVMDWVSMRAQERPAPVVPHEVRLDSGAVQMEIQKMVRQGGGHVVMELTPPDQSKFTIELKLDERGGALLVVEGVSDSTRTRLEQSAPQLREQFQQMGLELQLDMRQQNQSASSSASNFAGSQEREGRANLGTGPSADMPKGLSPRELGASRARESGSNQVYLYA